MSDVTPPLWPELEGRAALLLHRYEQAKLTIVTAESCTGGLVAALLTSIAGSSAVVDRGYVTYTNDSKSDCLDVAPDLLAAKGAVSSEVARAMADGALRASPASVSVAITGIAGPGGGSAEKPVGLVHFASAKRGAGTVLKEMRFGDMGRRDIRLAAVATALDLLEGQLESAGV
ncbi:MAG: CinA family protein [Beijerinckiaceae bacterium]